MSFDIWGKKPRNKTGEHFGCNCWAWLPIWVLIKIVNEKLDLFTDEELRLMKQNNNIGLNKQKECNLLVTALNDLLKSTDAMKATGLIVSAEHIQLPMEWTPDTIVDENRHILTPEELASRKGDFRGLQSAYRVKKETVLEFIAFLRTCGGFEVG